MITPNFTVPDTVPPNHRLAWMEKAHKLIGEACHTAWIANNKQPGYSVPPAAKFLISCIARGNEESAKAAFIRLELDNIPVDCITWPERCDWPKSRTKTEARRQKAETHDHS